MTDVSSWRLTNLDGNPDQNVTVILTPVFPPLGDLDNDGVVGSSDLIILLGARGDPYGSEDLIQLRILLQPRPLDLFIRQATAAYSVR